VFSKLQGLISKIIFLVRPHQVIHFGHILHHTSLEKDILLGTMPDFRRQGGQHKEWTDDLTEWSGKSIPDLVRLAEDRSAYQRFVYGIAHARDSGTAP